MHILCPQLDQNFQHFAQISVFQKTATQNKSIQELLLIQQQTDFINEIMKTQINSKKSHTFSTELSEISFDSTYVDKPHHLNSSLSAISLCKQYSKFFEEDPYDEAMNEIKRNCSRKTFNFIRDKLRPRQTKNDKKLQKEMRYNQQLSIRCLKLTQQVEELKLKLQCANDKLKCEQKKKPPRSLNTSFDKGEVYLKWQKAVLYKEKVQNQMKKNLNKQFYLLEVERKQNQQICYQIQNTLLKIQQGLPENEPRIQRMLQSIGEGIKQQRRNALEQQRQFSSIQKTIQQTMQQLKEILRTLK